ncbi:MAG: hypothetical protein KAS86_00635 [Candidatus Omnitrophica bacterium]|nr:hypothetical protein [Candidatus Omnitrophota bacterium]
MVEFETTISDIVQRTHNVKSFRLDDIGGVDFTAGQFMSVFLGEEKNLTRFLSISNSPTEKGFIEFTKKITDSKFSKRLDAAEVGTLIRIKYPMGNFTIREGRKKLAFLSGGIGITPIRSICKYICDSRLNKDVILLYGNRSSKDIAFKEDFDKIEEECVGFKVVHILSQPEADWQGKTGHISSGLIMEEIPDYAERQFYICGPPLMVSGMKYILKDELKLSEENIITENFIGY